MAEPCYVCFVRSEHVLPGCCGSVSVRGILTGTPQVSGSTHPFTDGYNGHPLSWPRLPLEVATLCCSQLKIRRGKGLTISEGNPPPFAPILFRSGACHPLFFC